MCFAFLHPGRSITFSKLLDDEGTYGNSCALFTLVTRDYWTSKFSCNNIFNFCLSSWIDIRPLWRKDVTLNPRWCYFQLRSTYPGRWSEKRAPIIRGEASSKPRELFAHDSRAGWSHERFPHRGCTGSSHWNLVFSLVSSLKSTLAILDHNFQ